MRTLEVLDPGPLSLIEDFGRPGWSAIGVSASGAFDRASLALANRLVGNPDGHAGIEAVLGGLCLQAGEAMVIAVTGAIGPVELLPATHQERGARPVDRCSPVHMAAGERIRIGMPEHGLRSYLAVRGGIALAPTLGSQSCDLLCGLGPPPLIATDLLPVGPEPDTTITVDHAPVQPIPTNLEVIPGPHHHGPDALLHPGALAVLRSGAYLVEPTSNRIGIRLRGPALPREPGELPSAPMRPGAIQVPGDGQPIVLGPDAPTTGGFPVLATLTPSALNAIGQARPGDLVRFHATA